VNWMQGNPDVCALREKEQGVGKRGEHDDVTYIRRAKKKLSLRKAKEGRESEHALVKLRTEKHEEKERNVSLINSKCKKKRGQKTMAEGEGGDWMKKKNWLQFGKGEKRGKS